MQQQSSNNPSFIKHGELRVQNSFGVWRRRYVLVESANLRIFSKYGAGIVAAAAATAASTTVSASKSSPPLSPSISPALTKRSSSSKGLNVATTARKCIKLLDRYTLSSIDKTSIRVFPASSVEVYMFSIIDPAPTAASAPSNGNESVDSAIVISLASESLEEAKVWKNSIEQAIKERSSRPSNIVAPVIANSTSSSDENDKTGKKTHKDPLIFASNDEDDDDGYDDAVDSDSMKYGRKGSTGDGAPVSIRQTLGLASKANWKTLFVTNGLRIQCETALAAKYPCLLVGCVIPATPRRVFELIRDPDSRKNWDGLVNTFNIIHQQDKHSRIEYTTYFPRWISSFTYASARDSLELNYWTREEDGSYAILSQSIDDTEYKIPKSSEKHVRMSIFASGFTITPVRSKEKHSSISEKRKFTSRIDSCYLQYCCHADPGGILGSFPRSVGLSEQFLVGMMLRVIGIRECAEAEKYGEISLASLAGTHDETLTSNKDVKSAETSKDTKSENKSGSSVPQAAVVPTPSEKPSKELSMADYELEYGSFDRNSWRQSTDPYQVRGKTYADDGVKIPSGDYMFDLFAVDLFEVNEPLDHVAIRPNGVAQHFLKKQQQNANPSDSKFLFIVHFKVPGSTLYAFSLYFSSKPGVLNEDNEFSHLFQDYVDADDEFRDSRFKIIPRVVKGSYIVKKGVGTTPAILGKKIKLNHYRGQGYYEADVDLGSSSIAGGILGLVKGYATMITIDLAFLLEGHREEELPERIIGSIQIEGADLSKAKKLQV